MEIFWRDGGLCLRAENEDEGDVLALANRLWGQRAPLQVAEGVLEVRPDDGVKLANH